jgi:23S rRNA (pseudouridine1915-N3)-methyltransferase
MRILIVAIGQRLPDWAQSACDDYLRRFGGDWRVEVKALKPEPRHGEGSAAEPMRREAERIRRALPSRAAVVALDERGDRLATAAFAAWLGEWREQGREPCFVIGGADGLDPALKRDAARLLRLSDMTLPHALARVLLVEQLYRAYALAAGHPYHRE